MRVVRGMAGVLFDEEEKFDHHLTMRAPKSLADRVDRIASAEKRSANKVKVTLLRTGADVYEWLVAHRTAIESLKSSEGLRTGDIAVRILELGLAAFERERRTKR